MQQCPCVGRKRIREATRQRDAALAWRREPGQRWSVETSVGIYAQSESAAGL